MTPQLHQLSRFSLSFPSVISLVKIDQLDDILKCLANISKGFFVALILAEFPGSNPSRQLLVHENPFIRHF